MGISADLSSECECRSGRATPRPNDLSYCEMCVGSLSTDDPTCSMTPYSAAQSPRGQDGYPPTFALQGDAILTRTRLRCRQTIGLRVNPKVGCKDSGVRRTASQRMAKEPWRAHGGPNSAPGNDQIMPTTRLTRNARAGRQDRRARCLRTRCGELVILLPRRLSSERGVSGGTALRRPVYYVH